MPLFAQITPTGAGQPGSIGNTQRRDTTANKSNTNKWKEEEAQITYQKLNSARIYTPDTELHTFQREPFSNFGYRDMGNLGSPINNLFFTPEYRVGPTLGYHIFDTYRYIVDSLNFYNTKRPYSVFTYHLGSKLEQIASIMHTQNIKPNWNVAAGYRKINSPGYYKVERNNHDNAYLTTNYKSLNKHYELNAAIVYNKEQHDENGGIANDSELSDPNYTDRRTVDVAYQNDQYSITRSSVSNMQRDFTVMLQQSYVLGRTDTTYNADSTQYTYHLVKRFSVTHKLELSTEKHVYKDLTPDSLRYTTLFQQGFGSNNYSYFIAGQDSVFTQQKWFWVDNKFLLNGYIGKEDKQLGFSAGIGNRYDEFISTPVRSIMQDSLPRIVYSQGTDRSSLFSNYLVGEIKKEALSPGQWEYGATASLFLTGADAGDFVFNAALGKELKNDIGSFAAGFQQQLNDAPYSYTNYENMDTSRFFSFNKESVTMLHADLDFRFLRLSCGVKNYVIDNYIYINQNEVPAQYSTAFTVTQLWARKVFKAGNFYLDNELAYQQLPSNAPVNIPALMGRHQLSYEKALFNSALKIATGIEVRYHTNYYAAGYDALLNRFFYQNTSKINNPAEVSVFLNFRVKRFRAFIIGDQLQQLISRNIITNVGTPLLDFNGTGNNYTPVYAAPDAMIRFGFSWVLVN